MQVTLRPLFSIPVTSKRKAFLPLISIDRVMVFYYKKAGYFRGARTGQGEMNEATALQFCSLTKRW